MNRLQPASLALTLALFFTPAHGQITESGATFDLYQTAAKSFVRVCSLQYEMENMGTRGPIQTEDGKTLKIDGDACVIEKKVELKKHYESALKYVKKPAARSALKEHYTAAIGALNATAIRDEDTKGSYRRRQDEGRDRMEQAWAKFEVER